jgi:hypothetical protein
MDRRDEIRRQIEDYFADVGSAGLVLPSGWYGRPYDSGRRLEAVAWWAGELVVTFDDDLALTCASDVELKRWIGQREETLELDTASPIALTWIWYDHPDPSRRARRKVFPRGPVQFVHWWYGARR